MSGSSTESRERARGIPRVSDQERLGEPTSYAAMRTAALDFSQAASGRRWTDYNIHDPGVTLLEAACYALTELDYPLDFAVADHLCGHDGTIDQTRQGLFAAPRIMPSAATTAADICQIILDADNAILDARLNPASQGLQSLSIFAEGIGNQNEDDREFKRIAVQAYHAHRGLGEDLADDIETISIDSCQLVLDALLTGSRDEAEILADIFDTCNVLMSQRPEVRERAELEADGTPLDAIYTGPLTRSGAFRLAADTVNDRMLSASTLREKILAVPGIKEVTRLDFRFDGQREATASVGWDGRLMKWDASKVAPRLITPQVDPQRSLSSVNMRHPLGRRGLDDHSILGHGEGAAIDTALVVARFEDLKAKREGRNSRDHSLREPGAELPRGNFPGRLQYRTIGNLLPPVYGLAEPPDQKDPAPPSQLAAYLALVDQLLVNTGSLVDHLGELFNSRVRDDLGMSKPSYWPHVLSNEQVNGIEQLYSNGESGLASEAARQDLLAKVRIAAFGDRDLAWRRKDRILDFFLALYGEQVDQSLFRLFFDYLDFPEFAAELLDLKSTYLSRIDLLTRDRAAGRNIALPPWSISNTSGFAQRIALKLGFSRLESRRLAHKESKDNAPEFFELRRGSRLQKLNWVASSVVPTQPVGGAAAFDALAQGDRLPSALLRRGLDRRNYYFSDKRLLLDAGEQGRLFDLGRWANAEAAGQAAHALRCALLDQARADEGLHVIEHILLRHRLSEETRTDLALRVTVVLPNWTARTARSEFQSFAEAVIRAECPAHLAVNCLWLDHQEMATFEGRLERWNRALADHVAERKGGDQVDTAADRVWQQLKRRPAGRA